MTGAILALGAVLGIAAVWLGQRWAREHRQITAGPTGLMDASGRRLTRLEMELSAAALDDAMAKLPRPTLADRPVGEPESCACQWFGLGPFDLHPVWVPCDGHARRLLRADGDEL